MLGTLRAAAAAIRRRARVGYDFGQDAEYKAALCWYDSLGNKFTPNQDFTAALESTRKRWDTICAARDRVEDKADDLMKGVLAAAAGAIALMKVSNSLPMAFVLPLVLAALSVICCIFARRPIRAPLPMSFDALYRVYSEQTDPGFRNAIEAADYHVNIVAMKGIVDFKAGWLNCAMWLATVALCVAAFTFVCLA